MSDNFSNDLITGYSENSKLNDEYSKLLFYEAIKKSNTAYLEKGPIYYSFDYIKGKKSIADKAYKQLINDEFKIIKSNGDKRNNKAESIIVDDKIIGEYTLIESDKNVFKCVLKTDNVVYKVYVSCYASDITISDNALNLCLNILLNSA